MYKTFLLFFLVLLLVGCQPTEMPGVAETSVDEIVEVNRQEVDKEVFVDGDLYVNKKFGFQAKLWPNFEVRYLEDDKGFVLTRQAEAEYKTLNDQYMDKYEVYISVTAYENYEDFEDLSGMLQEKYAGLTQTFFEDGVFVDELLGETAYSRYFLMSEDGETIYEALLKVPSFHYKLHKAGYQDFVKTIQLI